MKHTSLLFVCLFAGTAASHATLVFADDFSGYADGTALTGHAPVVGSGTWGGTDAWKVNGGAVSLVDGGGGSVIGYFASPLAAGQKLTLTFDTQAITGFLGSSWAVVSLLDSLDGGHERCAIGDPGGDNTTWGMRIIGDFDTTDSNQANTATFSYVYNTGAWTFSTNGGGYSGAVTPGYALDHLRIASGGYYDHPIAGNMKLSDISVSIDSDTITSVPEPGSLLALGGLLGSGMFLRFRRRG